MRCVLKAAIFNSCYVLRWMQPDMPLLKCVSGIQQAPRK